MLSTPGVSVLQPWLCVLTCVRGVPSGRLCSCAAEGKALSAASLGSSMETLDLMNPETQGGRGGARQEKERQTDIERGREREEEGGSEKEREQITIK